MAAAKTDETQWFYRFGTKAAKQPDPVSASVLRSILDGLSKKQRQKCEVRKGQEEEWVPATSSDVQARLIADEEDDKNKKKNQPTAEDEQSSPQQPPSVSLKDRLQSSLQGAKTVLTSERTKKALKFAGQAALVAGVAAISVRAEQQQQREDDEEVLLQSYLEQVKQQQQQQQLPQQHHQQASSYSGSTTYSGSSFTANAAQQDYDDYERNYQEQMEQDRQHFDNLRAQQEYVRQEENYVRDQQVYIRQEENNAQDYQEYIRQEDNYAQDYQEYIRQEENRAQDYQNYLNNNYY